MSFIETLENIDQKIVLAINGSHTPLLDQFMFYSSEKWVMIPFYLLLVYFTQKLYGWKITGFIIAGAVFLVALCDLTASYFFKNMIMRYRPSHHLELKEKLHIVKGYRGGEFGFYSSHASNMMALAIYCGYFLYGKIKHYSTIAFVLVFIICMSRIYLGVHYPSDILAGLFAGTVYALLVLYLFKLYVAPKINFSR